MAALELQSEMTLCGFIARKDHDARGGHVQPVHKQAVGKAL
jgi:hypothetical protein